MEDRMRRRIAGTLALAPVWNAVLDWDNLGAGRVSKASAPATK